MQTDNTSNYYLLYNNIYYSMIINNDSLYETRQFLKVVGNKYKIIVYVWIRRLVIR